jgi:hypothetical protein
MMVLPLRAGCLAFVILLGCSDPPTGASIVRLRYPEVVGAPTLHELRVLWGVDKWGFVTVEPGDDIAGWMVPNGGGGGMTLLFDIDGKQHTWNGRVGSDDDGKVYGVEIEIDPLGSVAEKHCARPCDAAIMTSGERWRRRVKTIWRHVAGIASLRAVKSAD